MTFDPKAFIAQAQQANPAPTEAFDPKAFIKANTVDATGELRPDYANGSTEESPINSSPVSVKDRLVLSLGNEKGKIKYLKENYQDAKVGADGNYLVKNQGMWHRVDPTALGDGDPWEKTKELFKDTVDLAPEATMVGATMAAGVGTGGAGILATGAIGGAVEIARTSLGRAFGTYEADTDEQIKDIAFETMLNIGGGVIAAGVKPVGRVVAGELRKAGQLLSKAPKLRRTL